MVDISVAIPTYNGSNSLPEVLERLRSQVETESLSWEVIVADNNSTDDTAQIVRHYQHTWPQTCPLRYCFVAEQGAAFARQRAVEIAQGHYIGFLDDDNLPAADWVAKAYAFGVTHPEIGAFGSQIHGAFEADPPPSFKQVAHFLAIIERGSEAHRYEPKRKILPPGAGLVVRRQAWLDTVPKRLFLNHAGKQVGLASEDLEALLHIQKAGWEIWYNPAMVVHHKIPNSRLQQDYLTLLMRCIGLSCFYIRMLGLKAWQRPFAMPAYMANDLRKWLIHVIKYRNTYKTDLRLACEREHLASRLSSPFFLLNKAYSDHKHASYIRTYRAQDQTWIEKITQAFEQDRFHLYQQRVMPLTSSALAPASYEILLRLETLTENRSQFVSPLAFIPTAERHNLMRTIDRWVIRKVFELQWHCYQSSVDIKGIGNLRDIAPAIYSINLSSASITDGKFISFLNQLGKCYPIPPQFVCFEISERVAIANLDPVISLTHQLKALGYQITLDDFGSSQSSQEYIKQLPADALKIAGHQLFYLDSSTTNHQSNYNSIQTIAKNVETATTLETLKRLGINYAQGYGIAKPMPLLQTSRKFSNSFSAF
ncbi:MAG: EAL domain-containing protein [Cyanothece sp. SIO1E1]|nr:EAL domain-containing protein [Cyanothece sp. SIO1E1]